MFPAASTTSSPSRTLRRGIVRTLDIAVEFATLGEYGVEEVELSTPGASAGLSWDWPARCQSRARLPRLPRAASSLGCGAAGCGY